jgi:oligosaccharyltransferase complex subunit beta
MGNRESSTWSRGELTLMARLETGNAAFANDFSSWIFQESGVVKVVSSTHHRDDETEPRDQYTKKDPVVSL